MLDRQVTQFASLRPETCSHAAADAADSAPGLPREMFDAAPEIDSTQPDVLSEGEVADSDQSRSSALGPLGSLLACVQEEARTMQTGAPSLSGSSDAGPTSPHSARTSPVPRRRRSYRGARLIYLTFCAALVLTGLVK